MRSRSPSRQDGRLKWLEKIDLIDSPFFEQEIARSGKQVNIWAVNQKIEL